MGVCVCVSVEQRRCGKIRIISSDIKLQLTGRWGWAEIEVLVKNTLLNAGTGKAAQDSYITQEESCIKMQEITTLKTVAFCCRTHICKNVGTPSSVMTGCILLQ